MTLKAIALVAGMLILSAALAWLTGPKRRGEGE